MKYVKNLVKILVIVQCFLLSLLFCVCDNKEIATIEQKRLNLADFVKCPFNEGFDENTDLEKYVLKKFGKPEPDNLRRKRGKVGEHSEVIADYSWLMYENYEFEIMRGVNRKFKCFEKMLILDFKDLKHGINKDTTIKDIERLFGKSEDFTDVEDSYIINYDYEDDSTYFYRIRIAFRDKKLKSIRIAVNIADYRL